MEIRLNKMLLLLTYLLLISCKGEAHNNKIEVKKEIKKELNFFDKKYENSLYSLVVDESNISDHPIKSHLDCKEEGYFTLHFVPKTEELRYFWKKTFLREYDFDNIDLKKDDAKISDIIKNHTNEYSIFSYQIKKEYLDANGNCTVESVYAKKNTVAQIYYYNASNDDWELKKEMNSVTLPPYLDSDFFVTNLPRYFTSPSANNSKQTNKWNGTYSLKLDYGKLDENSEMAIDYDIEINNDKCTFSGIGYKTYFTDLCKIEEKGNTLVLKYIKSTDGDGFSDHSILDVLGTIKFENNNFFIKSPIVADKEWKYNVDIMLTKTQ
ncbi:DUF5991 domain-containing protein [Chryseobacterium sp. PBS4-4]|uniref:DUF5991 domain-containing protein n=1 Tax=Chryseobacterium edaphi TaxID=2976532 RepID=A0ABT2WBU3_9FLAO|nr:DUF5991 domain-containing protein [Chryseobacterium edaphi]MCU7618767.1 DUF5991 domain-containing protein [Chryseobacterium edaphi]